MLASHEIVLSWDFPLFISIAHNSSSGIKHYIRNQCEASLKDTSWETLYLEKQLSYLELIKTENLTLMPGAKDILELVQDAKIPHAVVTNSNLKQIEIFLDKLPLLNDIPYWITREDYDKSKPAPDAYLKALQVLGHGRENAIGFEDTVKGARALQAAGIKPVLICSSDHPQMKTISEEGLLHFESFSSLHREPSYQI